MSFLFLMILGMYARCVNLKVSALLVSYILNQSVPFSSRSNKRARLECSSMIPGKRLSLT